MTIALKSEIMRNLAHALLTRAIAPAGGLAIIDGSSQPHTLDSGVIDFMLNGITKSSLTLNEAIITTWSSDEPILMVKDNFMCRFMFLILSGTSSITLINCRQGPIIATGGSPVFPKVPDGYVYIGGVEIDSNQFFLVGDAADDGSTAALPDGRLDDSDVTFIQGVWPDNGPSAFDLTKDGLAA